MEGPPINGLRHTPERGSSGWFIWAGGEIDRADPSDFRAMHLEHLGTLFPEVLPYLAMPRGWRWHVALDDEDVWFDLAT